MSGRIILSLSAALCLFVLSCGSEERPILRTDGQRAVTFAEMIDDLAAVPIVLVGEIHRRERHHAAQLDVIRALHKRGVPLKVGLEMFHGGHQADLDAWVAGTMPLEEFLEVYRHNWTAPWHFYRDIFLFSRENAIPMTALNASPEITAQVAARGFASLSPEQLGNLPPVACVVDREYENFIRRSLGAHSGSEQNFRYFCEAQLLWDTIMAWNIGKSLEEAPGSTIVVLAGTSHVWKKGIPAQVQRQHNLPFRSILPESGGASGASVTTEDTDYLWLGI